MTKDFGMLGAKYEMGDFKLFRAKEHMLNRTETEILLTLARSGIRFSHKAILMLGEPQGVFVYLDDSNRMMVMPSKIGEDGALPLTGGEKYFNKVKCTALETELCNRFGKTRKTMDCVIRFRGTEACSVKGALLFNLNEYELDEVKK
jgi:hypothetical protein